MQVTYENRKGRVYYLCQGVTKTGRPRFYFAREPKDTPVERIPEGFEIRESVNGVVSLGRTRPVQILPEERTAVETQLDRHRKARNYRFEVRGKRIVVYERVGPDVEDLSSLFKSMGGVSPGRMQSLRAMLDESARFTPVMRFTLLDDERRTFGAERWCYLGRIDGWIHIGSPSPVDELSREFIPLLGTDELFDVRM